MCSFHKQKICVSNELRAHQTRKTFNTCCQKLLHSLVSRALRGKICPDMAIWSATGRKVTPVSPVSPSLQSMGRRIMLIPFSSNEQNFGAPNGSFETSLRPGQSKAEHPSNLTAKCLRIFAWWQLWQDKRTCDNGDFVHLLHPNGRWPVWCWRLQRSYEFAGTQLLFHIGFRILDICSH